MALRRQLMERGVGLMTSSDSEVATMLLAGLEGDTWSHRIEGFTSCVEGAYCKFEDACPGTCTWT